MRKYNLLCVLNGSLDDEQVSAAMQQITSIIHESGGKAGSWETIGRKSLAGNFRKKKNMATGYFVVNKVEVPVDKLQDLNWNLKHYEPLIRFMFNNPPKEKSDSKQEEMVTA
jgi:ribosomal protein S6